MGSAKEKSSKTTTRRKHTNSKLGCLNCKRKKIRCDETLPACLNCSKSNREPCSYLSLSVQEIYRIKLTHSLRQNQNSKIKQDYRLPTSSLKKGQKSDLPSPIHDSKASSILGDSFLGSLVLEIEFELQDLPINIPDFAYPVIQFRNTTADNYDGVDLPSPEPGTSENEMEIPVVSKAITRTTGSISSHDSYHSSTQYLPSLSPATSTDSASDVHSLRSKFSSEIQIGPLLFYDPNASSSKRQQNLEGAHKANIVFKNYRRQEIPTRFKDEMLQDCRQAIFSSRFLPGSVSLLDSVQDIMAHANFSYEAYECLMMATMLLSRSGKAVYLGNKSKYDGLCDYSRFISETYKLCDEWREKSVQCIEAYVSKLYSPYESNPQEAVALCYTSCFISVSMLLLWYDYRSYIKSATGVSYLMYNLCPLLEQRPNDVPGEFKYLMRQLQYIIKSISIPSYQPTFLYEFKSNFLKLVNFYNSSDQFMSCVAVEDEGDLYEILQTYKRLSYYYNCLSDFLVNSLLPVVFTKRDPSTVCVYSPELIYELWGKWFSIFPGDTEVQPPYNSRYPQESAYLADLSSTLFMYYYALLVAMDAIMPSVKYLFSVSFLVLNNEFFNNKDIFKSNEDNYLSLAFKPREYLLKNNYYTMRLFAFFRRRFSFFIDNTQYINDSPYTPYVQMNRLFSRCIPNVQEVYIRDFNTTLIRPEHYPTRKAISAEELESPSVSCVLTRSEEEDLAMYARNIEKLNFCNDVIQYDTESKLLIKDYRPFEQNSDEHRLILSLNTLKEYYEDRALLLA